MIDMNEFNKKQVEWYKKQIEWNNKEIGWLTSMMEMERRDYRKMREWVWSKGVVTEWEMKYYGDNECKTSDFRKYKNQRRKQYRDRKYNKAKLAKYMALVG